MATYTEHYNLKKPAYEDTRDIGDINGNMDLIDTALHGKIDTMTASSDPTASGEAVDFIATLSQGTDGTVTATKKTVREVAKTGAGLCPALPNENTTKKFLRQDGSWAGVPVSNTNNALSWNSSVKVAEVNGDAVNVKLPANPFGWQIKEYSLTYQNMPINAQYGWKASDMGVSTPSGYTPVAVVRLTSGNDSCSVTGFNVRATGDNTIVSIRNHSNSLRNGTIRMDILYLKNT